MTDHGGAASPRTPVVVLATGEHRSIEVPSHPCPDCGAVHLDAVYMARAGVAAQEAPAPEGLRVTHGRHCTCSACARQDWAEPGLAHCGMHGPSCPPVYAPLGLAGDNRAEARPPEGLDADPAPPFVEAALALVDAVLDRATADPDDDAAKAARKVLRTDWTARSAGGATKP